MNRSKIFVYILLFLLTSISVFAIRIKYDDFTGDKCDPDRFVLSEPIFLGYNEKADVLFLQWSWYNKDPYTNSIMLIYVGPRNNPDPRTLILKYKNGKSEELKLLYMETEFYKCASKVIKVNMVETDLIRSIAEGDIYMWRVYFGSTKDSYYMEGKFLNDARELTKEFYDYMVDLGMYPKRK